MDAVWFVIFFICLQQFEGNLIYPKVVGSTIGLPGVWVMTAVTIFSNLFGILGIILGNTDCSGSIHGDAPRDNEPPCGARAFER